MSKNPRFAQASASGQPRFRPIIAPNMVPSLAPQLDCVDADFITIAQDYEPKRSKAAKAPPIKASGGKASDSKARGGKITRAALNGAGTADMLGQNILRDGRFRSSYLDEPAAKSWTPWNGEPLSTSAFYTLCAGIMALSFWASGGHSIFLDPTPPKPVSIISHHLPLNLERVNWDVRYRASKPILFVSGIVNNPHRTENTPQDITIVAQYKDGGTEKLFLKGHSQPLAPFAEYQFHGQLDLKRPEIASVAIEFKKS